MPNARITTHVDVDESVGADEAVERVQSALLAWFERAQRKLPWRETTDGYAILVSEVMLQQTQVERVVPVYHAFLRRFPT
ncbi:MAG: A/G-specific adenine glycosylase, partial [Chloroflexota bacterium]|nr:A/G-specific adenine glycosylase [Chloroflexota bacterium]